MDAPERIVAFETEYIRSDIAGSSSTSASTIERWYTVAELATMTGFSKSEINAAIRRGLLEAHAPNGGTRYRKVRESEWQRYVADTMS